MIKVIEETNKNEFETKVNELIKEGYRVGDSRCGNKYSAILIGKDEKNNYIKIPTLSEEQIEELKKQGMIGDYKGEIVKAEPSLTKLKTVEEMLQLQDDNWIYVNGRTEEIVSKVNEIVDYINRSEENKKLCNLDIDELSDQVRGNIYKYITRQSK